MKTIGVIGIVLVVLISGIGAGVLSKIISANEKTNDMSDTSCVDRTARRYTALMNDQLPNGQTNSPVSPAVSTDYPIGTILWQYQITGDDTSPKSIVSLPDINADGIDDVVIGSDDDYYRCFSGGALGTGQVLWSHDIYAGAVYSQTGITVTQDVNGDGYNDVVIGAAWGAREVQCISGLDGQTIWTHDTHEYGGGGWVYQVDCQYDFNGDGVRDVLACTGDDGSGTGPNRVYCLNGLTGLSIWEHPLGGPGFAVVGVADFTGDGLPDVVAGCSDAGESTGFAKGLNGATGAQVWSFTVASSAVWTLSPLEDITGDGIPDVIVGDFSGHVYGLNCGTGGQVYMYNIGSGAIITHFARLSDVNGNGYDDIAVAHSTTTQVQVLDGFSGGLIWSHPTADQPWNIARSTDISGDAIDDVFLGTLYSSNYAYFLSGVDGSALTNPLSYGEAVDAIAAIPDVTGDNSMEMVVGGRNGKVTCYSGGLNSSVSPPHLHANFTADQTNGFAPFTVHFTDLSFAQNTTITSWQWDFNHDGTIDSTERNPAWTYQTAGNYTVSLTISDGHISDTETKDRYITVHELQYDIVITNVTGGILKLRAKVENHGTNDVMKLNWSIALSGGLVLVGKTSSGTIQGIISGDSATITDKPLFGFGKIIITISVELPNGQTVTKTVTATLLFFFVLGIK